MPILDSGPSTRHHRGLHHAPRQQRPPRALHGSRFQHTGFVTGPAARDVVEVAVLSGRLLLFGPLGTLDSLPVDAEVTAHRCRVDCRC